MVENSSANEGDVGLTFWSGSLEKEMATHFNVLI